MSKFAKRYTLVEKRAAETAFLVLGSVAGASRETGIDRRTITRWMKTDWWAAWEVDITAEIGKRLTAKMRGVSIEAYNQLQDRLQNGDVATYKDGHFRHPIAAKDLSIIGNVASDKIRLAEGKATSRNELVDLSATAAAFEKIAEQYREKITHLAGRAPVIEGQVVLNNHLPGDK